MKDAPRRVPRWLAGLAVTAVAVGIVTVVVKVLDPDPGPPSRRPPSPMEAVRPRQPPGPNDPKPPRPPEPRMPQLSPAEKAQLAEQVRGKDRPGEAAFRAVSDRYVDENLDLAKRQAQAEGLTLDQVRELTYFGLLVLATQRVPELEAMLGKPLTEAQREALGKLMQTANAGFREAMRGLVARGGSEEERWTLIRSTEASYQAELFRISGLDAERLDDMLAGDLTLPGAPARGEEPTGPPAGGPRDDLGTQPRPRGP